MEDPPDGSCIGMHGSVLRCARAVGAHAWTARALERNTHHLIAIFPDQIVAKVAAGRTRVRDPLEAFGREVAVARFLSTRRCPVVAPADSIDAGPHVHDGEVLAFWRLAAGAADDIRLAAAARALRTCHEALMEYGSPGLHNPWREAAGILDGIPREQFDAGERDFLRQSMEALGAEVEDRDVASQAVHGDSHLGNALFDSDACAWLDWEDVFLGSIEWDIACLVVPRLLAGDDESVLSVVERAYGRPLPAKHMRFWVALRSWQLEVWSIYLNHRSEASRRRRHARRNIVTHYLEHR
jgi:hypothetical protein